MSARRGTTLVEVLIAAAVSLGILAVLASMFSRGLNAWQVGQRRACAQQSGLLAMHDMTCNLRLSDVKSVTIYPTADMPGVTGISFVSALRDGVIQHDAYGEILWQKFSVYYFDEADATLRYREEPVATPVLPDHPLGEPVKDPDPLTLSSFSPTAGDRVVAGNVKGLTVRLPSAGGNPVTVSLLTGDDEYESGLTSSVIMENGFLKANPRGRISLNKQYVLPPLPSLRLP